MEWLIGSHPLGLLGYLILAVSLTVANAVWLRRLGGRSLPTVLARVSVLIPARNEEGNLGRCLASLLDQDYDNLEIHVLDDQSTDQTAAIAAQIAANDARVHLHAGTPLPDGWLGKHWACHQLAQFANGELLLFIDADTWFHPRAVGDAVALLEAERYDLLSLVPLEEMGTFGERILVPYFLFANFAFVPLFLARLLRSPAFSCTIGQFLLFRRAAYDQIGGHWAVRAEAADDMALGRRTIAAGLRWSLADGTARMRCRMYHSFGEAWHGFSKNMFAGFGYRLIPYLFIWIWSLVAFWEPLIVLLLSAVGRPPGYFADWIAVAALGAGFTLWLLTYLRLRLPLYLVPAYPLLMGVAFAVAMASLRQAFSGASSWKGRSLGKPKIRVF